MYATIQEAYRIPAFDPRSKSRTRAATVENFEAAPTRQPRDTAISDSVGMADRVTYKGQANDYKYYQQNYGLKFPEMEGFSAGGTCGNSGPLYYELPISAEATAAHKKAMDQSLEAPGPSTRAFVPEERIVDMNKVGGYVDDELEQYLSTRETASAPAQATADNTAFAKIMRHFNVGEQRATAPLPASLAHPVTRTGLDNRAWDLIILVFFGLLIILLCEQLFKLAMMLSMKETVNILKPYLK